MLQTNLRGDGDAVFNDSTRKTSSTAMQMKIYATHAGCSYVFVTKEYAGKLKLFKQGVGVIAGVGLSTSAHVFRSIKHINTFTEITFTILS